MPTVNDFGKEAWEVQSESYVLSKNNPEVICSGITKMFIYHLLVDRLNPIQSGS